MQSDNGDDETDGKDENNKGVDLEARGFVGVESCKEVVMLALFCLRL